VVDQDVLRRLLEGVGGDATFVSDLIDQFLVDAPALLAQIRAHLDAADPAGVRRAAHTLKSNAATFGLRELADRARVLEEAAREEALVDARGMVEELDDLLERAAVELPAAWTATADIPAQT
jgi:HPt (histidine-containing phosphotransfer) domain-containing protein